MLIHFSVFAPLDEVLNDKEIVCKSHRTDYFILIFELFLVIFKSTAFRKITFIRKSFVKTFPNQVAQINFCVVVTIRKWKARKSSLNFYSFSSTLFSNFVCILNSIRINSKEISVLLVHLILGSVIELVIVISIRVTGTVTFKILLTVNSRCFKFLRHRTNYCIALFCVMSIVVEDNCNSIALHSTAEFFRIKQISLSRNIVPAKFDIVVIPKHFMVLVDDRCNRLSVLNTVNEFGLISSTCTNKPIMASL